MEPIIYLDMDGVLVDFYGSALPLFGVKPYDLLREWPNTWDLLSIFNVSREQFIETIDRAGVEFWENLEWYHWAERLLEFVLGLGVPVRILSNPFGFEWAAIGKYIKIGSLNGLLPRLDDVILTADKGPVACPRSILVDDFDHNLQAWEEGGGHAVSFPQPWNEAGGTNNFYEIPMPRRVAATEAKILAAINQIRRMV